MLPMDDKSPPLFVPLRAEFFRAFADGTKTVEWRKFGPRFNERTLFVGRRVTLSNGYSGERLFGRIVQLEFAPAERVGPLALLLYKPRDLLVGLHVKLVDFKPQRPMRR
jgi:hypothetical protein